jgi:hypothetical protein
VLLEVANRSLLLRVTVTGARLTEQQEAAFMKKTFKVGDHVAWNSEA